MIGLIFLIIFWLLPLLIVLLLTLSITDTSLGFREWFVDSLVRIFEWGSSRDVDPVPEEDTESISEELSASDRPKLKRRSSSDLLIIKREKSQTIDNKLHSTEEPSHKQTTVSVLVDDTLDFITAGLEAIIEDDVTSRFQAEQLPSWNLLTRTSASFHHISFKMTVLWVAGFLFRYLILVPIRIFFFAFGIMSMVIVTFVIGFVPSRKIKKYLNRHTMLMCMRINSRAFSSIIRFHNRENRAMNGGICVANHTSPIDVLMLSCDNCYAMIGQRQGGFLGFLQTTLSRAEHHIWFERSEAGDRKKVVDRMKEHTDDPSKLPIIIFPEGTCINNTGVMMFKKGSFEIGSTIYPIAMKYDCRLTDAFWNSSQQSYGEYLWRMMTSWAIICDVWYLPPMTKEEGEDAISFARRVKRAIAKKGGLVDLEWDGMLKRERVSSKLVALQQKLYYERLARTTTICDISEEDKTDVMEFMQNLSDAEREKICRELDENDDESEVIRKVSLFLPTKVSATIEATE